VIGRFETVLRDGKPLLVFPEGTRSEDGVLHAFKNGGFYAAVRAGVPVVPVALEGTYKLMMKGAIDTGDGRMRKIKVKIGAPILPAREGRETARVTDLRERTYTAVAQMLRDLGGQVPDVPLPNDETADKPRAEAPPAARETSA
jgi:1-acyl-sn-glycerol-3-phosphate acyltransferase